MKQFFLFACILFFLISAADLFAQAGIKNYYGVYDTSSVPYRTVSTMMGLSNSISKYFNKYFTGDIIADDTCEVSTSSTFTNKFLVLPNILYPLPNLGVNNYSDLYVRQRIVTGRTGVPNVAIRIWGE